MYGSDDNPSSSTGAENKPKKPSDDDVSGAITNALHNRCVGEFIDVMISKLAGI